MRKFFSLIAAVLFAGSMMADVVFTTADFAGQGTQNSGSEVTATKDGVTFTYSKGYCADESLRCYAHGALSITASANISKIQFTTTGGKTGGLDSEVTVNATSYSVADLASQARFTEIRVLFDGEGGGEGGEGGETLTDPTNCAEAATAALSVSKNNEEYNGGKVYTIEGFVTEIAYAYDATKGNMSFWMADTEDGGKVLEAYKCTITSAENAPAVGDKVAVTGKLTKYNTTPEFAAGCTVEILEKAGGEGGDEVVLDVVYAEAAYNAEYGAWQFNLYKDYNEETEEVTYPDLYIGVIAKSATALAGTYSAEAEIAFIEVDVAEGTTVEATSSSDLIVAHLGEGVYHYELSFVGDDGKTYKLDAIAETPAYDSETDADIELDEDGGGIIPPTPEDLATKGVHTLTPALVTDEAEGTGSFSKILDGIQLAWEGAFYNGTAKATNNDFRVYANKTMTITAGANIVKIEIAGLAKKDQEISVNHGNITVGGEKFAQETTKGDIEDPLVVIESIDAKSLTISVTKQLQARIIRVTLEGSQGIEETLFEGKAVKVLHEGQFLIMKGDHTYTPMGQIVK